MTIPPSDAKPPPKRTSVQLSLDVIARLDAAAKQTGLTRPRIVEHLVIRMSLRDLVKALKAEKPTPSRPGRPKMSVFRQRAPKTTAQKVEVEVEVDD